MNEESKSVLALNLCALVTAGALPLVFPLFEFVSSFPPDLALLLRDWIFLTGLALALALCLRALLGGLTRAVVVVLLASIVICALPSMVRVATWLRVGQLWVDVGTSLFLLLVCLELRRTALDQTRDLLLFLVMCCVAPIIGVILFATPRYAARYGPRAAPRAPITLSTSARPNIYHIVLDELGSPEVLSKRFGVDLRPFVSALRTQGFTVHDCASANYVQTYLSIGSMLNAEFFQDVVPVAASERSRIPAKQAIEASRVISSLKSIGYRVVWVGSGYSATEEHPLADVCLCQRPWIGEFEAGVLATTGLGQLFPIQIQRDSWADYEQERLDWIAEAPNVDGPTFTFIHILSPHPPFVFAADGSLTSGSSPLSFLGGSLFSGTVAEYRSEYGAQAAYIVHRMAAAVTTLLTRRPRNSIVIISGDHGPRASFDAVDARRSDPAETLPVFLAIRWPDGRHDEAGPVSLVNVYREIFTKIFGAPLPDKPSRHYMSSFANPYDWHEVPTAPCGQ